MFTKLDHKKQLIDNCRPLPQGTERSLRESLLLKWIYNSNAIEGNTLTIFETKVVLEGITVGGKTIKEHLEVINHYEAIQYVEKLICEKEPFSERNINNIHQLLLSKIDDLNAGTYRKEDVRIVGTQYALPSFLILSEEMKDLLRWYYCEAQPMHPIERASLLHIKFVRIHPFIDGNGRIARILLNFELMKCGYPPVVISLDNRSRYYNSLEKAHCNGKYEDFINLIEEELNQTLSLYFKLLNIE